jgi:hypothetical protein
MGYVALALQIPGPCVRQIHRIATGVCLVPSTFIGYDEGAKSEPIP